ncbi:MAG TPA: endospore germination permease [Bacillus bacterium]|nr:endospore germination permease [Bacillus sp. (in: firmicutes)]
MLEKGRISPLELSVLVILFTIGTTILATPSVMTAKAHQDAWLSSLISVILCGLLAFFYVICGKAMKRETYTQYLERVYGKIIGKMLSFSYVYFGFIGACSLLYQFSNFVTTHMLVDTPLEVLNVMLALLVILVVRGGLEVLAKTGELLIPWFMFMFFALVILLIPQIEIDRLSPLYVASFRDHMSAILNFLAFAGFPLVIFLMFYPGNINRPDKTKWNFIIASLFGCVVAAILVLLCILVLGAPATTRQMFPGYVLAKTVSVFDIVERIEAVMASMWVLSIFFKTAVYFYGSVIGLADIVAVKDYRFLILPFGLLTIVFSTFIYPNVTYMTYWDSKYWVPYSMIMGFFIPLLTLCIDKIKSGFTSSKQSKGKGGQKNC